jgi:mRNA interferase MazF
MQFTMSYDFGDVVLVHFPQSGTTARKQRPGIVVLDIGDSDIVIVPVTSKKRTQLGAIAVQDLTSAGLIRTSWMRLAKAATLLKVDVLRKLGRIAAGDRETLAATWQELYRDYVS